MLATQKFLKACYELDQLGLKFDFSLGMRIGRGYADLGYEEFSLVSDRHMVSLVNGKLTDLPSEERTKFFAVPTSEEMLNKISELDIDMQGLYFEDQRYWVIRLKKGKLELVFKDRNLDLAIVQGLKAVFELSKA